ncbi:hypothetical protein IWX90DRAFT_135969 [Phyllosticta citrichinensis]|uniref:DUF7730 domain-containing protein n=1 Tax=Phyllosticta citrichinensis TaxID=1130410 RepID=A0ABR1XY35_9PEZI
MAPTSEIMSSRRWRPFSNMFRNIALRHKHRGVKAASTHDFFAAAMQPPTGASTMVKSPRTVLETCQMERDPQLSSGFCRLPLEVRLMIYEAAGLESTVHFFSHRDDKLGHFCCTASDRDCCPLETEPSTTERYIKYTSRSHNNTSLLHLAMTCQSIYFELLPLIYQQARLSFRQLRTLQRFLNTTPLPLLNNVRALSLRYHFGALCDPISDEMARWRAICKGLARLDALRDVFVRVSGRCEDLNAVFAPLRAVRASEHFCVLNRLSFTWAVVLSKVPDRGWPFEGPFEIVDLERDCPRYLAACEKSNRLLPLPRDYDFDVFDLKSPWRWSKSVN